MHTNTLTIPFGINKIAVKCLYKTFHCNTVSNEALHTGQRWVDSQHNGSVCRVFVDTWVTDEVRRLNAKVTSPRWNVRSVTNNLHFICMWVISTMTTTTWHGSAFHTIGPLWGIAITEGQWCESLCFLLCQQVAEQTVEQPGLWDALTLI